MPVPLGAIVSYLGSAISAGYFGKSLYDMFFGGEATEKKQAKASERAALSLGDLETLIRNMEGGGGKGLLAAQTALQSGMQTPSFMSEVGQGDMNAIAQLLSEYSGKDFTAPRLQAAVMNQPDLPLGLSIYGDSVREGLMP